MNFETSEGTQLAERSKLGFLGLREKIIASTPQASNCPAITRTLHQLLHQLPIESANMVCMRDQVATPNWPLTLHQTTALKTIKSLVPLLDRVLVQRIKADTKTAGGIFLPDSAVKELNEAKVLAVGPGIMDKEGKRLPMGVTAGDKVLIPQVSKDRRERMWVYGIAMVLTTWQYGGSPIKVGEEEYSLFRDHEYVTPATRAPHVVADILQYSREDQRVEKRFLGNVPLASPACLLWSDDGPILHIERLYLYLSLYLVSLCEYISALRACHRRSAKFPPKSPLTWKPGTPVGPLQFQETDSHRKMVRSTALRLSNLSNHTEELRKPPVAFGIALRSLTTSRRSCS